MDGVSRGEFTFFHPLRVRWSEVDPQGIVFNPNYLAYADLALTEYMRRIGFPYPDGLLRLGSDLSRSISAPRHGMMTNSNSPPACRTSGARA